MVPIRNNYDVAAQEEKKRAPGMNPITRAKQKIVCIFRMFLPCGSWSGAAGMRNGMGCAACHRHLGRAPPVVSLFALQ